MTEQDMVTSKEIISKTGISRATLNNYIKLGILPKPVVGPPRHDLAGVRQIGYFPPESLERVYKVKLLKRQGMTMEQISRYFAGGSPVTRSDVCTVETERRRAGRELSLQSPGKRTVESGLHVTICDIEPPAYLINHNFEVEWMNTSAEEILFQHNAGSHVNTASQNIFKLFLEKRDRLDASNWQELASLHLAVLQGSLDETKLLSLYGGITAAESDILVDLFRTRKVSGQGQFYHLPFSIASPNGAVKNFRVHTMPFREGIFFVYVPDDAINSEILSMLEQREKIISDPLRRRTPSLVSLCVLIADLQDSVKISSELLPSQYFELISGLWEHVGPSFEKYNGIYGKHVGDGLLYYFVDRPGENYIIDCINCAIELRKNMKKFSNKWKDFKGWDNDLYLNTGIHEGQEFFGTIHSAKTTEFIALGDTINIAARLSEYAANGKIWATKNLISKLSQEERSTFHFGVHCQDRQDVTFVRDSFSRISDLITPDTPHYHHLSAIAGLPITEIKRKVVPSFI